MVEKTRVCKLARNRCHVLLSVVDARTKLIKKVKIELVRACYVPLSVNNSRPERD